MLMTVKPLRQYVTIYNNITLKGSVRSGTLLSIALAFILLATIVSLVYMLNVAKVGESFTEFYLLNLEGKADTYPIEVMLGEEIGLFVGIINREQKETRYRLEISIDGEKSLQVEQVVLDNQEKWEQKVFFTPTKVGENQEVKFLLVKQGYDQNPLEIRLFLDVKQ